VDWVLWDGSPPAEAAAGPGASRSPGSTVVRACDEEVVLLREGAIPFREITEFLKKG
jgi:tRNA A37 threonylcarbamoyladenosine synthetase subunit TsaC/SUA5/YrdC